MGALAGLIPMLSGLFSSGAGAAGGGGLMGMLSGYSDKMGGAKSMMSGPVPGATLPQSSLNQALSGSPTATNPLMSSTIGSQAPPATTSAPNGGKGKWQKYAQQQDVSAGLSAAKPDNPMYDQMMQQAQQGVVNNQGAQGNQQQPQRQMMTPAGMPQMPGAVHPNATWASLLQMLSGGG
jgi:hypothetical protein